MQLLAPDIVMSGESFKRLPKSCVYAWIRGDEWLYVGSTKRGFNRMVDEHHIIDKIEFVRPEDDIIVFNFGTRQEAIEYERRLIGDKQPKYNISGKQKYKTEAVTANNQPHVFKIPKLPHKDKDVDLMIQRMNALAAKGDTDGANWILKNLAMYSMKEHLSHTEGKPHLNAYILSILRCGLTEADVRIGCAIARGTDLWLVLWKDGTIGLRPKNMAAKNMPDEIVIECFGSGQHFKLISQAESAGLAKIWTKGQLDSIEAKIVTRRRWRRARARREKAEAKTIEKPIINVPLSHQELEVSEISVKGASHVEV